MVGEKGSTKKSQFRCIIAGGGTGGHLFPAIAVAKELGNRFDKLELLFVAGEKRMEAEILSRYGYRVVSIDVEGLKGKGWKKGPAVMLKLPKSLFQSFSIINSFHPSVVFGVGSYSAGPVCLASKILGIPTAVHEQNTYPGLTNRLLSRIVDRVFISFEESRSYLKSRSLLLTGNPVREDLFVKRKNSVSNGKKFTLLVLGGSQGARSINRIIPDVLEYLNGKERFPAVIHQTGKSDFEMVEEAYKKRNIRGDVVSFIEDMSSVYNEADLVVSRAGATTIFELAALGRPSILIPYPFAANRHQEINAMSLVKLGGAEIVLESELSAMSLAGIIIKYMDDRPALAKMGERARNLARPEAARDISRNLVEMARDKTD